MITDVAVDAAHASDQKDVVPVIERLDERGQKPGELFADAGYGSGENILAAQEHEVALSAPITCGRAPDLKKVQLGDFEVSADCRKVLSCIKGQAPLECTNLEDSDTVEAIFPASACSTCEFLAICPVTRQRAGTYRLRYLRKDMATSKRRREQETSDFKERYKIRSGIEATISEADRLTGFKRIWTRGKERVTTVAFMKALAINLKRFIQHELEKAKEALGSLDPEALRDRIALFLTRIIRLKRILDAVEAGMVA